MTDRTFDPNAWFEAYRETFAPVYKAQQEGLKTLERFARFHYAVAGDYLETSLAHVQAIVAAKSPSELMTKQAELGNRFGEKLSGRVQEFAALASEVQNTFSHVASEAAAKVVPTRKAA